MSDRPHLADRLARRYLPALVTVFLFYVPQLAALDAVRNRYFLFWGRRDTLAICVSIFLLWGVAILLSALIDRSGLQPLRMASDIFFLLAFGAAVCVNLIGLLHFRLLMDFLHRNRGLTSLGLQLVLGASALIWIVALVRWRPALMRFAVAACLVLSPLAVFILGPALFWTRWDIPRDPIPSAKHAGDVPGTPVYFLLFDEWSYARSTSGDDFLEDLPNLRALRARSYFFTNAQSPADSTHRSLPEALFQTRDFESLPQVFVRKDSVDDGRKPAEFVTGEPVAGGPESLFGMARRRGYMTYMLGFYLPYGAILGEQVKVCRSYPDYPKGWTFWRRMVTVTIQNPAYWRIPVLSTLWKKAYAPIFSHSWVRLNEMINDDLARIIDTAPRRSFVFVHHPTPHAPFIFEPDGRYRGPFPIHTGAAEDIDKDIMAGSPEDYHRSLQHLDTVVGRIVSELQSQGLFDDALLIVTSDHSWRTDPDLKDAPNEDPIYHVPLLVKLPGQSSPETIPEVSYVGRLRPLIEQAMEEGVRLDEDRVRAFFANAASANPGPS